MHTLCRTVQFITTLSQHNAQQANVFLQLCALDSCVHDYVGSDCESNHRIAIKILSYPIILRCFIILADLKENLGVLSSYFIRICCVGKMPFAFALQTLVNNTYRIQNGIN